MTSYLTSGVEEYQVNEVKQPGIKIPDKFISDPMTRYIFIDTHFKAPISYIFSSRLQNLFERIVDLLFTEAEEELLEEILDAVPDLISKQTLRLKVHKYQIENDFFESNEQRWYAQGQVQILERNLYKSTVLMNLDPKNPINPETSTLEVNLENIIVDQFIDDIPTRPASRLDRVDIGESFLNTNPNALGIPGRELLPLPDERGAEWYQMVFSDLNKYLNSLDHKLFDVSIVGILVKIMQYVVSGVDDFHVAMSEKHVLDVIWPYMSRALMFDLEGYFMYGEEQKGEEVVEYLIRNLNELKNLFAHTIGREARNYQLDAYIARFQREYLEYFQTRVRNIQVQLWEGYSKKDSLESTIAEIKNEELQTKFREILAKVKVGYGYSEVGITLVERHLRRLISAFEKGLLDEFSMRRNLEAILNVSGFNGSSDIENKEKFVQRLLSIIQGSADLSRFYEQLTQSERVIERREV